ncbi:MAG: response regulator transcription factor [Actinomycetota bacterium]|jgi:DNA-binding response OmpR family regulator|nr:response regulator transcription factor [Actinomycetota bacterium]
MSDNETTTRSDVGTPLDHSDPVRLLVAEDDASSRLATRRFFERMGYVVDEATDGPGALQVLSRGETDLVLLDLGLPGIDGDQVLAKTRRDSGVPVIVCTGRDSEDERIRVLDLGADDYLVKPLSFPELEARIRAVLRRGQSSSSAAVLDHGDLRIDRGTRTVTLHGAAVELTRREFDLLAFLAAAPGQVFTREDLLEHVWGSTESWQVPATVTEHIRRIRAKVEADPDRPAWIETVRGVGYRFVSRSA